MKSSTLLIILMTTIRFALAQEDGNLVRNGRFEQGNVGFKSDCRYFSYDVFWGKGGEGFQEDSIYFSENPFGVGNVDPNGKKDSLYFSKDAYGESFFVTNNRFCIYEKLWKGLVVDSLELAIRIKQCTDRLYSAPVKDTTGNFLLAWNAMVGGYEKLWYDSITVKPNTTYSFSCIESYPVFWNIFAWNRKAIGPALPGIIKLCVNGEKVSNWRIGGGNSFNEWRTLSGMFTSGHDQTRIEISIENMQRYSLAAVDNIVFKEIQPGEYKKEFPRGKRFPKLGDAAGIALPRGVKQDEDWILYPTRVKKEEPVKEIPPVKGEEPVAIITPPAKEEEPLIETSPVKKEEALIEIPPVIEEEPVVEILPKLEPSVVVPTKPKASVEIPPKPKPTIIVPPKPKLTLWGPPKPKSPVEIKPREKPPVIVPSKSLKKETETQIAASAHFNKEISIDEIKVDQKLQLSHIYFERAKYYLLVSSFPELNDLVTFMKKYPTVRIRLEGHTDNQGNPQLNVELSENRAQEVKKYLVDQGIDETRIEWVGYGGQRPIYSNTNENLRPKNRRVEIVIIGK